MIYAFITAAQECSNRLMLGDGAVIDPDTTPNVTFTNAFASDACGLPETAAADQLVL